MKTKLLGLAVGLLAVANTSAADADQYNLTILPGPAYGVNDLGQVVGTVGGSEAIFGPAALRRRLYTDPYPELMRWASTTLEWWWA
jgi:hypothetical protein